MLRHPIRAALIVGALLAISAVAAFAQSGTLRQYTILTSIGDIVFNRTTVSNIMGPLNRPIPLTNGKSDLGVPMTAAAGTPTGTVGVSRTAGTSLTLVGEVTSSSAKTDKVMFEYNMPDTYIAGNPITVTVNASVSGSGTLTGASTTMTLAAYSETNGVEAALTVSAAQPIVAAGSDLVFTVTPSAAITAGRRIVLELTMLITSASGANTGAINSVIPNS
jgi:hypothetical protein